MKHTVILCCLLTLAVPYSLGAAEMLLAAVDKVSLGDLLNMELTVATKTKTTAQEAPSIVSVISGEEIKNMGARDLIDVLRTIPGFDMTLSPNDTTYKINIRGMISSHKNNKIKIMIDGHSLSALWGDPHQLFNGMPVANIKQIEIIRGPGSALYGTDAFLGVINIITKQGGDGQSQIAVEGGSFNTIKPYGRLSYSKDDLKVSLYADYSDTDGYKKQIDSDAFGTRPTSAAPGDTTNNAENYVFHGDIRYKDFYFSGYFQKRTDEMLIGMSNALTNEDDIKYSYAYGEIGYSLPIDRGNVNIRGYYDYAEQDALMELFSEETASAVFKWTNGESIFGLPYAKNSIIGAEISADYNITDAIQIVGGTSYEYYEQFDPKAYETANIIGKPLLINGVTYKPMEYLGGLVDVSENGNWIKEADRAVFAVYGQSMFDIKKMFSLDKGVNNLSLTAGVRYDNYDDFGSTVNPRIGIVYGPSKDIWFKVLYGTAFRAPNFKELYSINNPSVIGNETLDSETISTAELLIGYKPTEKITTSLTLFDVKADDLIQQVPSAIPGTPAIYANIGKQESIGIEAEIKMFFDKGTYAYCNLTWQDVKDKTHATIISAGGQVYTHDDFFPGAVPEFYGNVGVNYRISDNINANLWMNYVGKRDRSEEMKWGGEDGEQLVPADQRSPVTDRTLFNASLIFSNFYKGWELQLSGFNLFDADHKDPDRSGSVKNDLPLAGASFIARLSYSF
jgi:iron complex outermembrane receptor protein